jgi:hypothetical protein
MAVHELGSLAKREKVFGVQFQLGMIVEGLEMMRL